MIEASRNNNFSEVLITGGRQISSVSRISHIWCRALSFVLIIVIVYSLSGCGTEQLSNNSASDHEISVASGDQFTISTQPNASTGWRLWLKEYDQDYLTLVQDVARPDTFQAHDFIFKALKKGTTRVMMESKPYWWESIPADKQKNYPPYTSMFTVAIN
jgi:hypothetical protein